MEPQVQFCTNADGTQLAYATIGNGKPLVCVPGWGFNLESDLRFALANEWFQRVIPRRSDQLDGH